MIANSTAMIAECPIVSILPNSKHALMNIPASTVAAQRRISGVQKFGAFVKLDETGADGLLPIRAIGNEYFHFDPDAQMLIGSDTGLEIGLGQRVTGTEAGPRQRHGQAQRARELEEIAALDAPRPEVVQSDLEPVQLEGLE